MGFARQGNGLPQKNVPLTRATRKADFMSSTQTPQPQTFFDLPSPVNSHLKLLPTPIPLRSKQRVELVPFPLEELIEPLKGEVEAIVDKVQCPIELAASSVLSVAALAAQQHADVVNPRGIRSPLSLFTLSIARPSERKSTADNLAMEPVRTYERQRWESYQKEMTFYRTAKAAWWGAQQAIINNKRLDTKQKQEELSKIGQEPPEPIDWKLICSEPTIEGLLNQFQYGYPSLGIFNNDGGAFVGGYSMSKDFRLKTAATLSNLWNATPVDRTLKNRQENCRVANRRLSLHLMIQPDVAKQFFATPEFKGQGLFSRFLIAFPETTMGERFQYEEDPANVGKMHAFNNQLLYVLQKQLSLIHGTRQELMPTVLALDDDAKEEWEKYADYIEGKLCRRGELEAIADFAGKIVEHALRLAGVMTIVQNPNATTIDKFMLWRAANLMEYYTAQYFRIFDDGETPKEILDAEKMLEWLQFDYGEDYVTLNEIKHNGPHGLRKRTVGIVVMLLDHNWLIPVDHPVTIRSKPVRSNAWLIQR